MLKFLHDYNTAIDNAYMFSAKLAGLEYNIFPARNLFSKYETYKT